jgi:hypothetical protein
MFLSQVKYTKCHKVILLCFVVQHRIFQYITEAEICVLQSFKCFP